MPFGIGSACHRPLGQFCVSANNKESLLLAVIEQIDEEVSERLQAIADAAPSPWEGFRLRCRAYLELSLEPEIRQIILQDERIVFGDVPYAAQCVGIYVLRASLDELILQGSVAPIQTDVRARMIYGAVTERRSGLPSQKEIMKCVWDRRSTA